MGKREVKKNRTNRKKPCIVVLRMHLIDDDDYRVERADHLFRLLGESHYHLLRCCGERILGREMSMVITTSPFAVVLSSQLHQMQLLLDLSLLHEDDAYYLDGKDILP